MGMKDDDAQPLVSATNEEMGYVEFKARVCRADGTPCEGVLVTPDSGCFGPRGSEPNKEKNPITNVVVRPHGETVTFGLRHILKPPAQNLQNVGATLGPQRVWKEAGDFPSDAYLVVEIESSP